MRLMCKLVTTPDEARRAVEELTSFAGSTLIQQFLSGRREAVSFLYAHGQVYARLRDDPRLQREKVDDEMRLFLRAQLLMDYWLGIQNWADQVRMTAGIRCRETARSGFGFGLCCMGSSAGLMAMLVALGVMSIGWMAVIAVLVTAQKLLPARAALDVPLNVLHTAALPPLAALAELGVGRVSLGSLLFRRALGAAVEAAVAVREGRPVAGHVPSYGEVMALQQGVPADQDGQQRGEEGDDERGAVAGEGG